MLGHNFNNDLLKKYTAIFGTLFNDIVITRTNSEGVVEKNFKVPISFGNTQKFLARTKQDPNLDKQVAITMPRMSYEIMSYEYDGDNQIGNQNYKRKGTGIRYTPVQYNIVFNLFVLAKYMQDANQIVEQIIPFFRPDITPSVQLFPDMPDYITDVPIVLNSVECNDEFEGPFEDRRMILWTLSFTMKVKFYGPVYEKKLIKFVKVNTYATDQATASLEERSPDSIITVQPGMDSNGNPTTDINNTIPYLQIDKDDNWDYIVQISDRD